MTEDEQYALEAIRKWTWSGFHSADEMRAMLEDILADEAIDVGLLHAAIDSEVAKKRAAERDWPAVTDCDRLDAVFYKLHEDGICALHNAGYTMSDGYSEVAEACGNAPEGHYHGYCFYHGQDVERAIDGHGLSIAFGDLGDRDEPGLAVGRTVVEALSAAGFEVVWNGSIETRPDLPGIDWKRRAPPGIVPEPEPGPSPRRWWQFWKSGS